MFDQEFLNAAMKSAGVGAAVGWLIQFYMWREERNERKEAHQFIVSMLDKSVTEKVTSTNAITTLTTAINAVLALVKTGVKSNEQ